MIKFRASNSTLTPITTSDVAITQLKSVQLSLTERTSNIINIAMRIIHTESV